jgi:hypothetical protein
MAALGLPELPDIPNALQGQLSPASYPPTTGDILGAEGYRRKTWQARG